MPDFETFLYTGKVCFQFGLVSTSVQGGWAPVAVHFGK